MLIGIAGPSGSGKTTLAKMLSKRLNEKIVILSIDRYYKDLSSLPAEEREKVNFDVPSAIDWNLLMEHVKCLMEGKEISAPIYSFVTHTREGFERITPEEVIVVEGIFALWDEKLNKLMDVRVFVDTPLDICLIRRLQRDVIERGRDIKEVITRWIRDVRPGYELFVRPSARNAHLIIPEDPDGEMRKVAVDALESLVRSKLNGR